MRCPKSDHCIFDELKLIIFVSQGLTLSTGSLVASFDQFDLVTTNAVGALV